MCVFIFVPCLQLAQLETISEVVYPNSLTIFFSCSRVASLSCGFGGVLQNMATQGCFRNVRSATIRLFLDSAVLNPCTKRLRNSLSTVKTMNLRNCTPANQLYIIMKVCSERRRHVTCDVTWCCFSCRPACYTRTHHKHQFFVKCFKFTTDADGNQNKCEEVSEPWNALCTAKLKEVV